MVMARLRTLHSIALAAVLLPLASSCGDSSSAPDSTPPDARLASLQITGLTLEPAFDPDDLAYAAGTTFLTTQVTIVAEPATPEAIVTIDGSVMAGRAPAVRELQPGTNTVEIEVANGSEQRLYAVTIDRAAFAPLAWMSAESPWRNASVGTSFAADGETILAGTPFDDGDARGVNAVPVDQTLTESGAAHVFARDSAGTWAQEAYLKASNADTGDSFGHSSAIFADTLVVGSPREASAATGTNGDEDDNSAPGAGAAYVFVRGTDGAWTQQAYLKASDTFAGDGFGYTVAIHGDTIAVSASRLETGVIYLFTRDANGAWTQEAAVSGEDMAGDVGFGDALALQGDTLAVGAKWHGNPSVGAVYLFERTTPGAWSQEDLLVASNPGAFDHFGWSLALDGDTLVVGAIAEASAATGVNGDQADDSAAYSGAAYVFTRNPAGRWDQSTYLKSSNSEAGDSFGYAVAVRGDWLAVAADNEASAAAGVAGDQLDNSLPGSGALYLFSRGDSGGWSQQLYVKAAIPRGNVRMGRGLAFTDTGLAMAAPFEDGIDGATRDSGAIHVFE